MNAQVDNVNTPTASPASGTSAGSGNEPSSGDAGDFDFAALAAHDETEPLVPEVSGEAGSPPAVPDVPPPAVPASAEPIAPAAPPAPPAPVAAAQPAPPAPPEPPAPQPAAAPGQPPAPESARAPELTIEQHRDKFVPQLAAMYKLTDADVEELRVNPGEALPKLAGRLHYEVQMATYHGLLSVLPHVIAQQMRTQADNQQNEAAFFDKWPALKTAASNPQSLGVITNAISVYRQLNPTASLEDTIAQAGLAAMMTLRLPLPVPGVAPAPPAGNGAAGTPVPVVAVAPPAAPPAPPRPPGIGTTGHVPMAASGTAAADDIGSLVDAHMRGEI